MPCSLTSVLLSFASLRNLRCVALAPMAAGSAIFIAHSRCTPSRNTLQGLRPKSLPLPCPALALLP